MEELVKQVALVNMQGYTHHEEALANKYNETNCLLAVQIAILQNAMTSKPYGSKISLGARWLPKGCA